MEPSSRLDIEKKLWSQNYSRVMGLDEVGRGCLSGPVVAAGVILSPDVKYSEFNDSKKLRNLEREQMAEEIREKALYWTVQSCGPEEIDQLNILQASLTAMLRCAESGGGPDYLLVDGNRFAPTVLPHQCLVKGDERSASIAAASILAKVYRDSLMRKLHLEYPEYGWDKNVGYPTKFHYEALNRYGYTPYHRKSFSLKTDRAYRR